MTASRRNLKLAIASTTLAAITPLVVMPAIVDVTAGAQETASPIITDYSAKGSITIANPQTGATYALYLVKEYKQASDVTPALLTVTEAEAMVTNETATKITGTGPAWTGLALGQYYVKITGANNVKSFVVSVPSTNADRTGWNYALNITTKEATTTTEKKVVDSAGNDVASSTYANVGDTLYYQITSAIPANVNAEKYTEGTTWIKQYVITDKIADPNLTDVKYSVKVGSTALESGTDYNLAEGVITLTEAGRIKLATAWTADNTAKVVTTIQATVAAIGTTDGTVSNTADVMWESKIANPEDPSDDANTGGDGNQPHNPSNPDDDNDPSTPNDPDKPDTSTPVVTKWAKIRAKKIDESGTALGGAKFKLYACDAQGTLGDQIKLNAGATEEWTSSSTDGDTKGEVVIDGINTAYGTVCLVESQAPSGYELQPSPTIINLATLTNVTTNTSNVDGTDMNVSADAGNITNVKSKFPTLPLTGGKGIAVFAVLAALIAAGTVVATRKAANK